MIEKPLYLTDFAGRRTITIRSRKVFRLKQKVNLGKLHYKVIRLVSADLNGVRLYKLKLINYRGRKIQQTTTNLRKTK